MGRIGCLIDTGLSEASQKTWEFSVFSAEISLFRAFPFSGVASKSSCPHN